MDNNCPYCSRELVKVPKRKSKCPHCGEDIYLKREPGKDVKLMVTQKRADEIEEMWRALYRRTIEQKLSWLDVTGERIEKIRSELREKFKAEPSEHDIVWRIYNEELIKAKDYQDKKIIYHQMALELNEEGRDASKMLEYMHDCELYEWKKLRMEIGDSCFYNRVKIVTTANDCEACAEIVNRVYTIDEALETKPIPYKRCGHFEAPSKYPYCRTDYILHSDDDLE